MSVSLNVSTCTLAQRGDFDEIIDVRSPSEFADDHLPGARNCPVLNDEERHHVGLLYASSPFEARRRGAALVARNIARALETDLSTRPKQWRPLVYCWRGGMRSGSFVTWMRLIGWRAAQLHGGYKSWRRHALAQLDALPPQFHWRVICGATGSGKTRLLSVLREQGEQILDLESLAAHKGSILGGRPGHVQPSQKKFETSLVCALETFDPDRVVYIEAESRKIGQRMLPDSLLAAMRAAECVEIVPTLDARLQFLLRDYRYLGDDPDYLCGRLVRLKGLVDNRTLDRWQMLAQRADLPELFRELIERHYDPHYSRSQHRHFRALNDAMRFSTDDLSEAALQTLALRIRQS